MLTYRSYIRLNKVRCVRGWRLPVLKSSHRMNDHSIWKQQMNKPNVISLFMHIQKRERNY